MMALDLDFQGKRVLVTAGTKGVGKAVVGLLKQLGATVLTTARHVPTESVADAFVAADLTTVKAVPAWRKPSLGGCRRHHSCGGGSTARRRVCGAGRGAAGRNSTLILPAVRLDRAL
jgi:NAD(P)-dependent dehydrogenase (short-subunit alcohol dehydrogenase family)